MNPKDDYIPIETPNRILHFQQLNVQNLHFGWKKGLNDTFQIFNYRESLNAFSDGSAIIWERLIPQNMTTFRGLVIINSDSKSP
jgi:hypothetical protein